MAKKTKSGRPAVRFIGGLCKKGHRITEENSRVVKIGSSTWIECGLCYRNYQREYKRRLRNTPPERFRA